jgi:hypothetical protein
MAVHKYEKQEFLFTNDYFLLSFLQRLFIFPWFYIPLFFLCSFFSVLIFRRPLFIQFSILSSSFFRSPLFLWSCPYFLFSISLSLSLILSPFQDCSIGSFSLVVHSIFCRITGVWAPEIFYLHYLSLKWSQFLSFPYTPPWEVIPCKSSELL